MQPVHQESVADRTHGLYETNGRSSISQPFISACVPLVQLQSLFQARWLHIFRLT